MQAVADPGAYHRQAGERVLTQGIKTIRRYPMKTIEVVAAVMIKNSKVFATQRGYGDYKDWWEFPGGKIEIGETREAALAREIQEELNTEIAVEELIKTVEWDYPDFHLVMHCFRCGIRSGDLTLNEHEAARWLTADSIYEVNWLPADLEIIEQVAMLLKNDGQSL
jgi:8-oxo-dGTP diphosphatase